METRKSLRFWKIKKERKLFNKLVTPVVNRKVFIKLTNDKNHFGRITKGIKPELMSDKEYMDWIKPLPKAKLVL